MATFNSIEIFENTLLQLLVRRGPDSDRKQVILRSGELGYTTDTNRLYVGDGLLSGGNAIGNLFLGRSSDITTLGAGVSGDIAFSINTNTLNVLTANGHVGWSPIAGLYKAGDNTLRVDAAGNINVASLGLSSQHMTSDIVGYSMKFDNSNRITLDRVIAVDQITTLQNQYLNMPKNLNINDIAYTFPYGGLGNNKYLRTDAIGQLYWSDLIADSTHMTWNSGGIIPVGTIMAAISSNTFNGEWLPCNGQAYIGTAYPELSVALANRYGSGDPTSAYFNVPNLTNKVAYGANIPTSTSVGIVSGGTGLLSAQGVVYFIKAKPEKAFSFTSTIKIGKQEANYPLSSTFNGVANTGTTSNLISGDLTIDIDPQVIPKAWATFDQGAVNHGSYNVASIAFKYGYPSWNGQSGFNYEPLIAGKGGYQSNGYSGVYIVNFTKAIPGAYAGNKFVQIQAHNYLGTNRDKNKTMSNAIPKIDYKFISDTQLEIAICSTVYIDVDKGNNGYLINVVLDSGRFNFGTPNPTKFNLIIY